MLPSQLLHKPTSIEVALTGQNFGKAIPARFIRNSYSIGSGADMPLRIFSRLLCRDIKYQHAC